MSHDFHEKTGREGKRERKTENGKKKASTRQFTSGLFNDEQAQQSRLSAIEIDLLRVRFRQILTFVRDNTTDQPGSDSKELAKRINILNRDGECDYHCLCIIHARTLEMEMIT